MENKTTTTQVNAVANKIIDSLDKLYGLKHIDRVAACKIINAIIGNDNLGKLAEITQTTPPTDIEKINEIPSDATNLEVFAIKDGGDGKRAYIGFKIPNGNFHFIHVPYTEPAPTDIVDELRNYYIISKSDINDIEMQALAKKSNHSFPQEAFIEADACLDVISFLKDNSIPAKAALQSTKGFGLEDNLKFSFTTADNCKIEYGGKYWAVTFSNPEMNKVCNVEEAILGQSASWYKEPYRCFGLKENAEDFAKIF